MFLFVFSILSRRCPLLATFLSVLLCPLSLLISDSRFDSVWFRLSCDHGWIRSGPVNVRKTTNNNNYQIEQNKVNYHRKYTAEIKASTSVGQFVPPSVDCLPERAKRPVRLVGGYLRPLGSVVSSVSGLCARRYMVGRGGLVAT